MKKSLKKIRDRVLGKKQLEDNNNRKGLRDSLASGGVRRNVVASNNQKNEDKEITSIKISKFQIVGNPRGPVVVGSCSLSLSPTSLHLIQLPYSCIK